MDSVNMNTKKKVLIIDDERMNIMALAHFLKCRYEIIVAIDGQSGVEAAEKHIPDLILLDIIMPVMNGFDVISKLKKSEITRKIPVIFLSALEEEGDCERGLSLGAVDFITKPFSKAIVEVRIKGQLKLVDCERVIEDYKRRLGEIQ